MKCQTSGWNMDRRCARQRCIIPMDDEPDDDHGVDDPASNKVAEAYGSVEKRSPGKSVVSVKSAF